MQASTDRNNEQSGVTRRRALARVFGIALAGAIALSACGGGSDGPPPPAVAPTLQIVIAGEGTIGGDTPVSFKFSAPVTGFEANRVLIQGGTFKPGSFTRITDAEYSATLMPRDNDSGTLTVAVPPNGFYDATFTAGNPVNYVASRPFDTVRPPTEPFVSFEDQAPGGVVAGPLKLTIRFSLDVGDSFSVGRVLLTNATVSEFTRVSGTEYTLIVSPMTRGVMVVDIPAGTVVANVPGGITNQRGWQWGKIYIP
jgi:hypothetical protein